MLELLKKIEGSFDTNVIGETNYGHTINAKLQNGDYIDIYGLIAFLQDLSKTEETYAIVIPTSFGYKNQFYTTIIDLEFETNTAI